MEEYTDHWDKGMYRCAKCGQALFDSGSKFKSGTIWPSFRKAMPGAVSTRPDDSAGMRRMEIICSKCGEHLGHVFEDGRLCGDTHPKAGKRFCVLSDALDFSVKGRSDSEESSDLMSGSASGGKKDEE